MLVVVGAVCVTVAETVAGGGVIVVVWTVVSFWTWVVVSVLPPQAARTAATAALTGTRNALLAMLRAGEGLDGVRSAAGLRSPVH